MLLFFLLEIEYKRIVKSDNAGYYSNENSG